MYSLAPTRVVVEEKLLTKYSLAPTVMVEEKLLMQSSRSQVAVNLLAKKEVTGQAAC